MIEHQQATHFNPGEFVQMIYADRMRKMEDKEEVLAIYERTFGSEFPVYRKTGKFFIDEDSLHFGRALIHRVTDGYNV